MGEEDTKLQLEESMDGGHIHAAEDSSKDSSDPVGNLKIDDCATSEGQAEKNAVKQVGSSDEEGVFKINSGTQKVMSKKESTPKYSTVLEETKQSEDEDADTSNENISNSGSPMTCGKRDRRKVERLSFSAPEITKTKIESMGAGLLLGDDPYIDHMISHTNSEDLKFIHVLLYRRLGNKLEIKRNLRCFNGFSFSKEDEEFQFLLNRILKWPMKATVVKALCLFGQPSVGSKQELSERLADFLLCPTTVDKAVPARKGKGSARKKSSAKKIVGKTRKKSSDKKLSKDKDSQNGEVLPKSEVKARRKATPKKPKYNSNEDTEEDISVQSDESDEGEETPVTEPKAKRSRVSTPAKKAKSTPAQKRKKPDSDDLSDDEPLVKKVKKSVPTDDDIKGFLEGVIKSVDLEEMTMKSIYQKVYDQYPKADLTLKKEFIKKTVKKMLA